MHKEAILSEDKKFRYSLGRKWKDDGLLYGYFGVNPSTADASIDDATVKKWVGFTERNGGRGFIVGNVFAYRATDVKELRKVYSPGFVDEINMNHLNCIISKADILVPCWGNTSKVPPGIRGAFKIVINMLIDSGKPIKTFGLTKSNDPKHPLMLGYNTKLVDY
jgi:hypothetical protein